MKDNLNLNIDGHVKIWDPNTKEVFVNKHNAINPETMSTLIASAIVSTGNSYISEMHFGNGGTIIDTNGNITYKDVVTNVETLGRSADLFNPTYFKVVDTSDIVNNIDPDNNYITSSHVEGSRYTDIIVTCTLNQDEPVDQQLQDSETDFTGQYVFNELGLKSKNPDGTIGTGSLLTHIVFHPVQKSANRVIQVVYTLRIRIV